MTLRSNNLFAALALLAIVLWGSLGAPSAMGSYLVADDFSHPDGDLEGNFPQIGGVWTPHSGDGTNDVQVVSGEVKLVQPSSGEDIHSDFAGGAIGPTDVVYAAFDLRVVDPGTTISESYFAHFKTGGNFFGSRVWVTNPTTSGYSLAVNGDSSITDADGEAYWGSDLAFGTTYRVVTSYDGSTGNSKLWVDPSSEASTSVEATDGFAGDDFSNYALRQSSDSNVVEYIDCLSVATTFNEALTCIPEPASVVLALMAVMGLIGVRRRL